MKKAIFIVALLFLLIGAVSASENITDDASDTLSVEEATDTVEVGPDDTLKTTDTEPIKANESTAPAKETPTITTQNVKGTAGKTITLKATVKNSAGAVKGVKVTFTLDGKTYTATSDASGVASVKVKCPASKVISDKSKIKGKKLTETTKYSKTFSAKASIDGASSSFKVVSAKKVVKKYKITKKTTKIRTIKIKKGIKSYKKGNYAVLTGYDKVNGMKYLSVIVVGKHEKAFLKFYIKEHYKENGKWKWAKWFKIPKNKEFDGTYPNSIKIDKVKVKYTQLSLKKIK